MNGDLNPLFSLSLSLPSADKVEVCDNRVAVCRDHANGICGRQKCKYYHIPILVPPAPVMAAILHQHSDPPPGTEDEYQTQQYQFGPELEVGRSRSREGDGLDAIEGSCTNSITTSEVPSTSSVGAAPSLFGPPVDSDSVVLRAEAVTTTKSA